MKLRYIYNLILISLAFHFPSYSQESEIKSTVKSIFDAISLADSNLLKTFLHQKCNLRSIEIKPDGSNELTESDIKNFIESIGTKRQNLKLEERVTGYEVNIHDAMAIVSTPYQFFINDKLSHAGTNVFTLFNDSGKWKIINIIDTRKRF